MGIKERPELKLEISEIHVNFFKAWILTPTPQGYDNP